MRSIARVTCLVFAGLFVSSSSLIAVYGGAFLFKVGALVLFLALGLVPYVVGCILPVKKSWVSDAGLVLFWGGLYGALTIGSLFIFRTEESLSKYFPRTQPDLLGAPIFGFSYVLFLIGLGGLLFKYSRRSVGLESDSSGGG